MDLAPFLNRVHVTSLSLTIQRSEDPERSCILVIWAGSRELFLYATVLNVTILFVS